MKQKMALAALLVLIAGLALSAILQVYVVADSSGAQIFARGEEAYLFTGASHTGYHFRYAEYLITLLKEHLHIPTVPDDRLIATTVFHVTPSSTERHLVIFHNKNQSGPGFMTPFEDGLYGMCPGSVLCKWTGTGFEPATEQELRRHGLDQLVQADMNGQVVNQWLVRETTRTPGEQFDIEVKPNTVISVKNHSRDVRAYPSVSIDLIRPGQPPEILYSVNGTPHRVSRAEYARLFQK